MAVGKRSDEKALQKVLGQGGNVNAGNPLEVHDPKVGSLISYEGETTADGAADGSTLIDTVLTTKPDYNGNLVIITSGPYAGQGRDINGVTTAGTVTPTSAFGGQILRGTTFNIFALRLTPAEVAAIAALVNARVMGRAQIAATTIDLQQAAASYPLFTGTTQDVVLEKLVIRLPNVDCSDDAALTSISIQTDDVTPQVIISAVDGAVANLTAEAQLQWTGAILIKVGTLIRLTIAGGPADAPTVCDVVAEARAVVSGGYLA